MKTLRKHGRLALVVSLVVALAAAVSTTTFSAFTSPQGTPGNVVTAAPDWRGPTVTGGAGKLTGPLGYIKQGDTVYLFLNVTDTGNPASGVASVSASVTVPGFGTFNMPMTAGSYTVRGQTYNYRSAAQATPPTFPEQTLDVAVIATDNAGNVSTPTFPVVVDNTAPTATNIQTTNAGTNGRAGVGDTIVYTLSEPLDPYTIVNGWDGTTSQSMRVRVIDGGAGNDTVQLWNAGNTAQLPVGSINLSRTDFSSAGTTSFASSTMVMSGSTVTITLGGAPTGGTLTTAAGSANMIWTPSGVATDLSGNAVSITPRTELAPLDRDF